MTESTDWTEQARRLVTGLSGMLGDAAEPAGTEGDCRWCPLCQFAAVLRGERPEITAALADLLETASTALRNLAGHAAGAPEPAADDRVPEQPDGGAGTAPVQRIEII